MDINEKSIKIWSTIGSRATFGIAALDLAKEIDNLMILTCDVSTSAGLDRFRKTYPEKYLDLGIAEQNMIGVAAGLASENFNVITTTFAPFQTMRCCEQIKVNIGYMKQKICMVGIASGLALGTFGYTHCCIEDVGILRSIPGMIIISPADSLETVKALEAAVKSKNPSYLRLTGSSNNPIVYNKDYEFEIGKSITLREGKDITIFCSGAMVYKSLEAAKILESKKISSSKSKFLNKTLYKSGFIWPVKGIITGEYGNQRILNGQPRRPHYGLDISAVSGTKVISPSDAEVSLIMEDTFFNGKMIILNHGLGLNSIYSHLKKIHVKEREKIKKGDLIAEVGNTGRSTGPHLDWRINVFNIAIDPELLLSNQPKF